MSGNGKKKVSLRAQLKAAEQRAQDAEQRAQDAEKIINGVYYASMVDVWGVDEIKVDRTDVSFFNSLRRDPQSPLFMQEHILGVRNNAYKLTQAALEEEMTFVRDSDSLSRTSANPRRSRRTWTVDVFGNICFGSQMAHLVPASRVHANTYTDVARWALAIGTTEDERDEDLLRKAIHGFSNTAEGKRADSTGLKHFLCNKIRLTNQSYYDNHPCLMLVPAIPLSDVINWDGNVGYPAIVIAMRYSNGNCVISPEQVYKSNLCGDGDKATTDHINMATEVLRAIVLGLAYSLKFRGEILERGLDETAKDELKERQKKVKDVPVKVPLIREPNRQPSPVVRLVTFTSWDSRGGHPAPDPLLLGVKAATNWSKNMLQPMLAAAEPLDLEDNSDDEMDEREYYNFLEDCARLPSQKPSMSVANTGILGMTIEVVGDNDCLNGSHESKSCLEEPTW